jgi:hypothetical protein
VGGVFKTLSNISGTLGKGLATVSMDRDYINARNTNVENPRHVGQGIAMGVRDLGKGVFRGLTGVVVDPIKVRLRSHASVVPPAA